MMQSGQCYIPKYPSTYSHIKVEISSMRNLSYSYYTKLAKSVPLYVEFSTKFSEIFKLKAQI